VQHHTEILQSNTLNILKQKYPIFERFFLHLWELRWGINLKFTRNIRHSHYKSDGRIWITLKYISFYNLMDIINIVSTFQTMSIDTNLLNCECETASRLHKQNSCVFPTVLTQTIWLVLLLDTCYVTGHNVADPRTKDWLLVGGPVRILTILIPYLYFCKSTGPRWMKDRQPFDPKYVMIVYNAIIIVYSTWILYEVGLCGLASLSPK